LLQLKTSILDSGPADSCFELINHGAV